MSAEYRPLDDGGFVPSKPKGNDLLADSEAVGHRAPQQGSGGEEEHSQQTCCCTPGWLCVIAYLTGWVGGLIIGLSEKRCYFVVFHACQSMIISSIYCVFAIVFALIDHLVIRVRALTVWSSSLTRSSGRRIQRHFAHLVFAVRDFGDCVHHLCVEAPRVGGLVSDNRDWRSGRAYGRQVLLNRQSQRQCQVKQFSSTGR